MRSKLRNTKRNKGHGHVGTCCGMDYGNWSFLLLVGVDQLLIEGWQGSHTGHIEAGEMDTPEPRNKLRMANSEDMALLGYLEKQWGVGGSCFVSLMCLLTNF